MLSLTKHHSTKDELLSLLLVFLEGCHVQGTSNDVQDHKDRAYWYVDGLCWYATQSLDFWPIWRTLTLESLGSSLDPSIIYHIFVPAHTSRCRNVSDTTDHQESPRAVKECRRGKSSGWEEMEKKKHIANQGQNTYHFAPPHLRIVWKASIGGMLMPVVRLTKLTLKDIPTELGCC